MSMIFKETRYHRVCSIWFQSYEVQNQASVIHGDRGQNTQNIGSSFEEILTGVDHKEVYGRTANILCIDLGGCYVDEYICI